MRKVRFAAMKWAREVPTLVHNGRVDRLGHHLLLLMSTYSKNDGTDVWVSVDTLAREARAGLSDVEAAVKRLEDAKYVVRDTASNGAPGWALNLGLDHDGDAVLEDRAERRRVATRERMRRLRDRQKSGSDVTVESHVTPNSSVTDAQLERHADIDVTQECDAVTQECDAVTQQEASHPQVRGGVTPLTPLNSQLMAIHASHDAPHRHNTGTETGTTSRPLALVPEPTKPATKKQRRSKLSDEYTPEFEAWWSLYPRKADKFDAFQAFERVLSSTKPKVSVDVLTAGVKRYATEVAGRDKEHIKHGATWLNKRCWEDGAPVPVEEATLTATEWVRAEWRAGRVKPIEERTGLHYTPPDLPLHVTGDQIETFHANACREWITDNRDQIIARLTRSAS